MQVADQRIRLLAAKREIVQCYRKNDTYENSSIRFTWSY